VRAQESPSVVVDIANERSEVSATVSLRNLLSDRAFVRAMESGFPLYVQYHLELRQPRSGWFDQTVDEATWEYVVVYDPVRVRYVLEGAAGSEDVGGESALHRRLEAVYRVALPPTQNGTYYYKATIEARTLSDDDVDEVFDWLKGDADSSVVRRHGFLTRAARKLLVEVASLPNIRLSAQTDEFEWDGASGGGAARR
jgi:Domain of unknown function (DUF4390)